MEREGGSTENNSVNITQPWSKGLWVWYGLLATGVVRVGLIHSEWAYLSELLKWLVGMSSHYSRTMKQVGLLWVRRWGDRMQSVRVQWWLWRKDVWAKSSSPFLRFVPHSIKYMIPLGPGTAMVAKKYIYLEKWRWGEHLYRVQEIDFTHIWLSDLHKKSFDFYSSVVKDNLNIYFLNISQKHLKTTNYITVQLFNV